MRTAFNLIELVFTIVIMAGIFAVIPKIIFVTNKSDIFAIKQDALFNTISLTNIASLLAWDENNTNSSDILITSGNNIECNTTTKVRIGSFLSKNGRTCQDSLQASAIGNDGEGDYQLFNDIDDFNDTDIDVNTIAGKTKYKIITDVRYLNDTIFDTSGSKMTIFLEDTIQPNTTNIKKFKATVSYKDKNISSFSYYSTNIGQFTLNSEDW